MPDSTLRPRRTIISLLQTYYFAVISITMLVLWV